MALLDDIGTLITNAGLVAGATGWILQKGYMGDSPDRIVTVNEGVSKNSDHSSLIGHDYPSVQVLVRGTKLDYESVKTKIDAVIVALNDVAVVGQVYMLLRQYPIPLGLDQLQRPMISANFDIMRVR